MQQIGGGGHFINVKKTHACMLHIILLRAHFFHKKRNIGMKYVTYWYQIFTRREELVPILHGVKFAFRQRSLYIPHVLHWQYKIGTKRVFSCQQN